MHESWERESLMQLIRDTSDDLEALARRIRHSHACQAEGCGGKLPVKLPNGETEDRFFAVANGDGIRVINRCVLSTPLFVTDTLKTCS